MQGNIHDNPGDGPPRHLPDHSTPTTEQTGARSGNHPDGSGGRGSWNWGSHGGAQARRVLLEKLGSVRGATPLALLEGVQDRGSLLNATLNLLGVAGLARGLASPNPFLGMLEGNAGPVEWVQLEANRDGSIETDELERLFRSILQEDLDSARGIVYLVSSIPDGVLVRGIKHLLVETLREPAGMRVLNGWKRFVGVIPRDVTESERAEFDRTATAFSDFCDHLFDVLVGYLSGMAVVKGVDLDDLLYVWRDISKYYSVCNSREEVLMRESLLYEQIVEQYPMEWEKRKLNLDRIVRDPRFGLGEHLKLIEVEMSASSDHGSWEEFLRVATRHADFYGLEFAKHAAKKVKSHGVPKECVKKEEPSGAGTPGNVSKQCYKCRRWGHIAAQCPDGHQSHQPLPTLPMADGSDVVTGVSSRQCFRCGGSDHLVRDCHVTRAPTVRNTMFTLATEPKPLSGDPPVGEEVPKIIPGMATRRDTGGNDIDQERAHRPADELNLRIQADVGDVAATGFATERGRYLPGVPVRARIMDNVVAELRGVVDTCSSVNFVGRNALAEILRGQHETLHTRVPQVVIRTIHGSQMNTAREVELEISLHVDGTWTTPVKDRFLVYDGPLIPGGFDLLLSHSWIVTCDLVIQGQEGRVMVTCSRERESLSRGAQTGEDEELCYYSFPVDNCEVEDSDETWDYFDFREDVKGLRASSLASGPLQADQLLAIEGYVVDEPAAIPIRDTLIDPPIRLEGYPMNAEKLCAMKVMLERLEEDGIVDKVKRGSGYYTSPGFLVKKGEGKFRLVVDNTALNARLVPTPGAVQASSKAWQESLKAGHQWYGVLDIKDAFFRKKVRPQDQKYLHVRFFGIGEYRFNRLPQGLSCSPPYWNALMESILDAIREFMDGNGDLRVAELKSIWDRVSVVAYVDDILITGKSAEDVSETMKLLIQVLGYMDLYVPEVKRQGPSRKVICLGLQLCNGKIGPKEERLQEIWSTPRPANKDQLRSVLGVLNFCRQAVRPVDGLEPLLRLVQKSSTFVWGEEQERCWQDVVLGIRSIGVDQFSIHDVEEIARHRLFLATDASELGHGWAVHTIPIDQLPAEPRERIRLLDYAETMKTIDIGYTPFKGAELNYSTHDKEGMAMFQLLMRTRGLIYLFGGATVISDNIITLSKLRRWGDGETCDTTRSKRWKRWIADLADLLVCRGHGGRCVDHPEDDTDGHSIHGLVRLQHTSGKEFYLVDWLSRYFLRDRGLVDQGCQTGDYEEATLLVEREEAPPAALDLPMEIRRWDEDVSTSYCGVPMRDIWVWLQGDEGRLTFSSSSLKYRNRLGRLSSRFTMDEKGQLLYLGGEKATVAVPDVRVQEQSLRTWLIWMVHEGTQLSAHRGVISTAGTLRRTVWWPGMDISVADYVKSCKGCAVAKADARRASGTHGHRVLSYPNQLLVVDWAGPFPGRDQDPARFVLVMVDAFTGFCHLRGSANKDAASAVEGVLDWASSYGLPDSWTHDSDPPFVSEFTQRLTERFGMIDCSGGLTYTPRANGSAERYVRLLKECITAFAPSTGKLGSSSGWGSLLKAVQYCQNSGAYRALGITPFELMLGRKPRGMLESILGSRETTSGSSSQSEYVKELEQRLTELHAYWASRQAEERLTLLDKDFVLNGPTELGAGQVCIRIAYISNQRKVFPGEYLVVKKVSGSTNTYEVAKIGGTSTERVVGYQLVPITPRESPATPYFYEADDNRDGVDPESSANGRRALRGHPGGTIVASEYRGQLYIGELTSPYVTGCVVEILFYIPCGESPSGTFRYRRPATSREREKNLEVVDVSTIRSVGVHGTWESDAGVYLVPSDQFQ